MGSFSYSVQVFSCLVAARKIFLVAACGIFRCGMWDLYLGHVGPLIEAFELLVVIPNHLDLESSCLTRDQT